MFRSEAVDRARGMIDGGMSVAEANVMIVLMVGVELVSGKMSRDVRTSLQAAVKEGRLGHLRKDGHKPEAFFHPNSIWRAKEMRDQAEREVISATRKVFVPRSDL